VQGHPSKSRHALAIGCCPNSKRMIRRRCANAFAQTSNGHTSGIERIATAILSKCEKDCLVPSRIAAELTPKLRTYLGIVPLDTEGLEGLLEKHRNAIAQLEPTASEREAFLRTQLSDSLLRRLPIHVRSDGAIGDAENVFREADWPIPATLREHVPTIQLCSNPVARERQQRLITVWSPQSQLEIALSQTEPHRLRIDILDALAKLAAEKSEPELRLCQALRTTPWLAADERPIAPQDVLALPPSVDEAARALLIRSGQAVQFHGFGVVAKWPEEDRRRVYSGSRVPTEGAGGATAARSFKTVMVSTPSTYWRVIVRRGFARVILLLRRRRVAALFSVFRPKPVAQTGNPRKSTSQSWKPSPQSSSGYFWKTGGAESRRTW
jgi:hypothetical protein